MKKKALEMGQRFICPLCGNQDDFQENLSLNGVFIPFIPVATSNQDIANDPTPSCSTTIVENATPSPTEQPAKKCRIHKDWVFDTLYEDQFAAKEAVEKEEIWSFYYDGYSDEGKRDVYRCNLVKFRAAEQCEAQIYLLYHSTSSKVSLHRSASDHTHENNPDAVFRFSTAEEALVKEL